MKTNRKLTLKKEIVTALSNTQSRDFLGGAGPGPDTFHSNCLCISDAKTCTGGPIEDIYTGGHEPVTLCSYFGANCIPTGICETMDCQSVVGYGACPIDHI